MPDHPKQSAPPSPHDVYRGLPMGPGGIEPLVFHGHGPRPDPFLGPVISWARRWLMSVRQKLSRPSLKEVRPTTAECCP